MGPRVRLAHLDGSPPWVPPTRDDQRAAPTGRRPVPLSILAWDHPRATGPLAACRGAWERRTGQRLEIVTRSLASFGDDVPAAGEHDLVLIDHPHVGRAAADGAILALDDLLEPGQLSVLATASAGASHDSYRHDGRQWAIAVDAACQALAIAPGARAAPPATWDAVLALSRAHPGRVALPLHPAHAVSALLSLLAAADPGGWRAGFDHPVNLRWATATLAALAGAGPAEAWDWEPPDALARLAGGELVCVPLVYTYVGYAVHWAPAPACRPGGRPGSILGGVGAAVLAGAADPRAAARLAAWLGSPEVARELVGPAGGQPASGGAWTAAGADAMFAAVLRTLEVAEMRPRGAWWPECQRACGELLADGLRCAAEPDELATELSAVYHHHHEVTA